MKFLQDEYIYRRLHQPFAENGLLFSIETNIDGRCRISVTPDPQAVYDLFMDLFYPGRWQLDIQFSHNFTKAHVKIGLFLDGKWVWHESCAVQQSDSENPWETAFAQTALSFGVGKYLKNLPPLWLALNEDGSSPDPKEAFTQFPEWALPHTNTPALSDSCRMYDNLIRYPLSGYGAVASHIS
jgi:hypothetical protein